MQFSPKKFGNKRINLYIWGQKLLMCAKTIITGKKYIRLYALRYKTLKTWGLAGLFAILPLVASAQTFSSPLRLSAKTNLLYDLFLMPSLQVEFGVSERISVSASGTYGWFDGWPWHEKLRVVTGELGANYWLWQQPDQVMHSGFHVGPYAAIYRYDFLFGSKGQEAKANWGVGVNCGYSVALNRHLSFDFTLGLGYVGGKYKEYEPSDDISGHNVWTADKIRHYVGPTKAEIALVWHILGPVQKSGKGGNP